MSVMEKHLACVLKRFLTAPGHPAHAPYVEVRDRELLIDGRVEISADEKAAIDEFLSWCTPDPAAPR